MKHRNRKPKTPNAKVLMQRMGYGRMIREMSALKREPAFRGGRGEGGGACGAAGAEGRVPAAADP